MHFVMNLRIAICIQQKMEPYEYSWKRLYSQRNQEQYLMIETEVVENVICKVSIQH